MNTSDRDAKLTAFALNDPGLNAAERAVVEAYLETDADARRAVHETKQLAELLAAGLKAEADAAPAGVVTVPAAKPKKAGFRWTMAALAAAVLLAVGGLGYKTYTWNQNDSRPLAVDVASLQEREDAIALVQAIDDSESTALSADGKNRKLHMADQPDGGIGLGDNRARPIRPGIAGIAGEAKPTPPTGAFGRNNFGSVAAGGNPGGSAPNGGFGGGQFGGGFAGGQGGAGQGGFGGGQGGFGSLVPGTTAPNWNVPPDAQLERKKWPDDERLAGEGRAKQLKDADGIDRFYKEAEAKSRDAYPPLVENPFVAVQGQAALSTFGLDVDTASYSVVRNYLSHGQLPPKDAVRLEELVNYFPYRDAPPDGNDPYTCRVELTTCPWQPQHHLARIAVKAKPIASDKRPPSNLVFLIDVSGSMNEPNKLPLVKTSMKMLVNALGENDRVAMVVYAGQSGLVLDSTNATKKDVILSALDRLEAGGSTNGAGGLRQAYDVAVANFIKNGTNRVVLCTDGDWNVGTTSTEDLIKLVEEKRKTGVFLSVLGYGMGNLRDEMMVNLAGKGNGNYAYIDTAREANKALVEQIGGTLVTVAKDVKVQVEFNPAAIKSYRLLGYEKRILAVKDFADDTKDAGEMGAGHVVTAMYELVPVGAPAAAPAAGVEGLRYQDAAKKAEAPAVAANFVKADEAFLVKMRHKKPDADVSTLREMPVKNEVKPYDKAGEDFRFAASVASFALLLRDSPNKGGSNFGLVLELAESAKSHDPGGYRTEFVELVRKAKQIGGK